MKKISKTITLILMSIMCLSLLVACGDNNVGGDTTSPSDSNTPATSPDELVPQLGGDEGPTNENAHFADAIDIVIDSNTISVINPFAPAGFGPASAWTSKLIWDRLLTSDVDVNNPLPGLATEWHTDDWITFKFKLREGVSFSTFSPL